MENPAILRAHARTRHTKPADLPQRPATRCLLRIPYPPCLFLSLPLPVPFQPLPGQRRFPFSILAHHGGGRFTRPLALSLPIAVPFRLPCRIAIARAGSTVEFWFNETYSPRANAPSRLTEPFDPSFARDRSRPPPPSFSNSLSRSPRNTSSISITPFVGRVPPRRVRRGLVEDVRWFYGLTRQV